MYIPVLTIAVHISCFLEGMYIHQLILRFLLYFFSYFYFVVSVFLSFLLFVPFSKPPSLLYVSSSSSFLCFSLFVFLPVRSCSSSFSYLCHSLSQFLLCFCFVLLFLISFCIGEGLFARIFLPAYSIVSWYHGSHHF